MQKSIRKNSAILSIIIAMVIYFSVLSLIDLTSGVRLFLDPYTAPYSIIITILFTLVIVKTFNAIRFYGMEIENMTLLVINNSTIKDIMYRYKESERDVTIEDIALDIGHTKRPPYKRWILAERIHDAISFFRSNATMSIEELTSQMKFDSVERWLKLSPLIFLSIGILGTLAGIIQMCPAFNEAFESNSIAWITRILGGIKEAFGSSLVATWAGIMIYFIHFVIYSGKQEELVNCLNKFTIANLFPYFQPPEKIIQIELGDTAAEVIKNSIGDRLESSLGPVVESIKNSTQSVLEAAETLKNLFEEEGPSEYKKLIEKMEQGFLSLNNILSSSGGTIREADESIKSVIAEFQNTIEILKMTTEAMDATVDNLKVSYVTALTPFSVFPEKTAELTVGVNKLNSAMSNLDERLSLLSGVHIQMLSDSEDTLKVLQTHQGDLTKQVDRMTKAIQNLTLRPKKNEKPHKKWFSKQEQKQEVRPDAN